MAVRVNPNLVEELKRYGADDVTKCYHCGNCTATCPLSKEPFIFPRKSMRYLQMGLGDKLKGNLEPWLCYYCGECSEQCPREAEPGETMMSMRRWLTSRYDFTGLSRMFYENWVSQVVATLILAALTGIGFYWYGMTYGGGDINVYAGEKAFFPSHDMHRIDLFLFGILGALLIINCARMWWFSTGSKFGFWKTFPLYIKHIFLLPFHFLTQKRYAECDRKGPWAVHLVLMLSYLTMLILIAFFLHRMHSAETLWDVHIFGYLATAGLLGMTIYNLHGRLKKTHAHLKFSHPSDYFFLWMLIFLGLTGILQHILYRYMHMPVLANYMYMIHMMGVVPFEIVQVPFSKWAHLAYRPLGMYLSRVQADAIARREEAAAGTPVPAMVPQTQKQMVA